MNIIERLEKEQIKQDIPDFRVGDTLTVHVRIVEDERERIQIFTGICIARKKSGIRESITIRRVTYGLGVERVFLLHSPQIAKIEVVKRGAVRRAKLYYLREKKGKKARVKERK
ncbi:MAG: 50S ribosomal protein L19 [Candidatus Euphemobacter frigidus]|nr:50S ribosomal protein L19 [Candidatus Euphemobacter frigidus]MDP8275367.1 50S ribosomal protein L19 [Candidatus Euphemobacter frigidus]